MKSKILDFLARGIPFSWLKTLLPDQFVFYGHVISDKRHFVKASYNYPSFKEFDELVSLLKSGGYCFVSFEDYFKDDKRKKVLLTIDDGFKVVKDEMHEKLKNRGIPYVIFITTKPLAEPNYIFPSILDTCNSERVSQFTERLFLSCEDIIFLKQEGVHIGFHTKSHKLLGDHFSSVDVDEIQIDSKYSYLFTNPLAFSYPYYAPVDFFTANKIIEHNNGAKYFFDTKGLLMPQGNHLFRVCLDSALSLKSSNNSIHMLKRQLLQMLYKRWL